MPINDIAKTLGQIAKGSAMNNLADQAMAKANSQMQKIPGKGPKIPEKGGEHEMDTERALFMSVLAHAIESAGDTMRFRLDEQIRALNSKLSGIHRNKQGMDKLKDAIGSHDKLYDDLTAMIDKMSESSKQLTKHIR